MNAEPEISIVMPTFNTARFVQQAVGTILDQSFSRWELVVMDGGSTDGTLEILRNFGDPRIRIYSEPDKGSGHAFRKAYEKSIGKYIIPLCASDGLVDTTWLQTCHVALESDSDISMVWGLIATCTEEGVIGGPHPDHRQFLPLKQRPHPSLRHMRWKDLHSIYFDQINRILRPLFRYWLWENRQFLPRIIRYRLTQCATVQDVQKRGWLWFWLDRGMGFPDQNLCIRREVLLACLPPFRLDDIADLNDSTKFVLNFNQQGYLPLCIPRIASFLRSHTGQLSAVHHENIFLPRYLQYLQAVADYGAKLKAGEVVHWFRDGRGAVIGEWSAPTRRQAGNRQEAG